MSAAPALFPAEPRPGVEPDDTMDPRTRLVATRFRGVMEALGLDLQDGHLAGTPGRVARAYRELFTGLDQANEPELRAFPNTENYRGVVAVSGIRFHSVCAHHFLPFFGTVAVGYLPHERLVGLSKLARAVAHFARRPQVQERMTEEIAEFLEARLDPAGVIVRVRARHFCMEMRGVERAGSRTTTTAVRGGFADPRTHRQFLERTRGER